MMPFEFATSARIVFGAGQAADLGVLALELGKHAFVVTGRNTRRVAPVLSALAESGLQLTGFCIPQEPTIELIDQGVQQARDAGCDLVIAIGGGSAIDAGKALAALLTNPGRPLDYMEVIGQGDLITVQPAPCIAVPTTAGTGAEVTRNAVITSPEHQVKASIRSAMMIPDIALVDPELMLSMPPHVTASTGLDALTQLIEAFVSTEANPVTDSICRDGISRAAASLMRSFEDGNNIEARSDMALASLFGGMALTNAKLGAAHGFAAPVGGFSNAPHGVICGRILPFAIEVNTRALQSREPSSPSLAKFQETAELLTGNSHASADDGVRRIQDICKEMGLPALSTFGITPTDYPSLVEKSEKSSSMKGNPIKLTHDELTDILARACED